MEEGNNPQDDQGIGDEIEIPPFQTEYPPTLTEGDQFVFTFFEPMMIETVYTKGSSIEPSYAEPPDIEITFTKLVYTKIPQTQAPSTLDHTL